MCEAVKELAACRSWVDRTVDPQRRIPVLLWAAVTRWRLLPLPGD